MPINIETPMIIGATTQEQLAQVKDYLFKTAEQLNFALNAIDKQLPSSSFNNGQKSSTRATAGNKGVMSEQEAAFASIRDLIINSSEIVSAYSDAIQKRLTSEYVAQSPYGKYINTTLAKLKATADSFTQTIEDTQIISSAEGEEEGMHVYGKIKVGIVDEDGDNRLIGVEIGQTTVKVNPDGTKETWYSAGVRLVSDRLSFLDGNGNEVAYLKNYMMYITRAEITDFLRLGGYDIDATDGIAWKWGGNNE